MALSTRTVRISVDMHANVGIAHISIFLNNNNDFIDKINVCATDSSIVVTCFRWDRKKAGSIKLISPSAGFLPLSCSGLSGRVLAHKPTDPSKHQFKESIPDLTEVAFRLQCARKLNNSISLLPTHGHMNTLNLAEELSFDLHEGQRPENLDTDLPLFILCAHCRQKLNASPRTFQRVLNLPSGGWNEVSGDLFCHKHVETEISPSNRILDEFLPQENEMYVGELLLHFSDTILDTSFVREKIIQCPRCLATLGEHLNCSESSQGIAKLYQHEILFQKADAAISSGPHGPSGVRMIMDIINKNLSATLVSKLYLETERGGSCHGLALLLWVMDRNLDHFDVCIPICSLSGTQEIPMHFGKVIKVLYGVAHHDSSTAQHWRHDFAVEVYRVDSEPLFSLIRHLNQSTESILPSQRYIDDDLCVGYISQDTL